MEKQTAIQNIELGQLSMESVVECMGYGNSIIFITQEQRLIGAVTEGDIKRYFRSGKNILDTDVVNRDIHYIVDIGDSNQVLWEAERLFQDNPKIHNIPVVDDNGMLLYQMNRNENAVLEHVKEHLTNINECAALPIFLACEKTEGIVITGGSKPVLNWVKDWFEQHMEVSEQIDKIEIFIMENASEYNNILKGSVVICLSDIVFYYLRTVLENRERVLAVKEISQFYFYKELEAMHAETILNYFKLFGYGQICIQNRNTFIDHFIKKIEQCGITVLDREEHLDVNTNILQTDIFLYSHSGEYVEKTSPCELHTTLRWLQAYYDLKKEPLTQERYIEGYIACLKVEHMKNTGGGFRPRNLLDELMYNQLKELEDFKVTREREKQYINPKCIVDLDKVFSLSPASVIESILGNVIYKLMLELCDHVYLCGVSFGSKSYPSRTIKNYMENEREYFPPDFVENIYGKKDYPVRQLLESVAGCSNYRVSKGYVKYQSNYQSKFFNTDTYGCRITVNAPQSNYIGTIWMLGDCVFSGYAVEDCDTVASILQKKINETGLKYRVVNFSMGGTQSWEQINRLLEMTLGNHDIVIALVNKMCNGKDGYTILLDSDKFADYLDEEEYWDIPMHCGVKGYNIIAERIFEKIKPNLSSFETPSFSIEVNLKKEVDAYISDVKKRIARKRTEGRDDSSTRKVGAVVMNCNPFIYGHQCFVETASRLVDVLYIFTPEEDESVSPFVGGLHMEEEGTKDFSNVIVLPSRKFMISSVTFPGYFMKENPDKKCYDSFLNLKIFAHYIAPVLGISICFVGEDSFDGVTAQYNHDMKLILEANGINIIEVPRKKLSNETILAK